MTEKRLADAIGDLESQISSVDLLLEIVRGWVEDTTNVPLDDWPVNAPSPRHIKGVFNILDDLYGQMDQMLVLCGKKT